MRSKFSPRQKVVSFALAILTLGVLVILGYRLLGNIFAADQATGEKKKVTIALNNWENEPGQTYFHTVFSATNREKFRCSTIDIYVNNPNDKNEILTAVRDVVNYNPKTLSIGSTGLKPYVDSLLLEYKVNEAGISESEKTKRKNAALNDYNITVLPNSTYNKDGKLKATCDRGGVGGSSSIDYGEIKIPPKYASAGGTTQPATTTNLVCARVVPDGTNDSAPTSYKWVEKELLGADYVLESDTTKCGPKPTVATTTNLVCARVVPDGTNDSAPTSYKWVEKELLGADYVLESDTTKCGPKPTVATTGAGSNQQSSKVRVSLSVKTEEGLAVRSARVEINKLDNFGRELVGSLPDYVKTDSSGNAQTTIGISETDSDKIEQIQATAQKLSKTLSKQIKWEKQAELRFDFVLNLSREEAELEQNWTAAGGQESYVAPTIDYDPRWPGGKGSLDLIAVRRSMHNANYNGYTPVGGVEFYINVYTNTPPANARRTKNTLGSEKALAQSDGSQDPQGAEIPPPNNNEYSILPKSNTSFKAGAPVAAPLPYNQNEVTPYNSALLKNIRERNNTKYSYRSMGRIADNGLNSGITIGNLPQGIYDIELRKPNFYSSRFIMIIEESGTAKRVSLPIAPKTYAEPPSIDSGKILKQPNKDIYSANGFIYISKYPWFGWQRENEYILRKPEIASGIPMPIGVDGRPIGGGYGSPEMQECIGRKMKSVGVGVSGLTMKDALLGVGGAYLLKQSGKQNDDWVKGGMIAGGIYSLIELAKSSDAKVNINYDEYDCAELLYGARNTIPIGCEGCFMNVDGPGLSRVNCDPRCFSQYSPWMNVVSSLPFGNLFGNK